MLKCSLPISVGCTYHTLFLGRHLSQMTRTRADVGADTALTACSRAHHWDARWHSPLPGNTHAPTFVPRRSGNRRSSGRCFSSPLGFVSSILRICRYTDEHKKNTLIPVDFVPLLVPLIATKDSLGVRPDHAFKMRLEILSLCGLIIHGRPYWSGVARTVSQSLGQD